MAVFLLVLPATHCSAIFSCSGDDEYYRRADFAVSDGYFISWKKPAQCGAGVDYFFRRLVLADLFYLAGVLLD